MQVSQIAQIMNGATNEILGLTATGEQAPIATEDLSVVVEKGKEALGATDVENYTRKLIDRIGRVVFVDRKYSGSAPSILMDAWDFGSIREKISGDIPDAEDNPAWGLQDGQTYNQDVFTAPNVSAKFYNKLDTLQHKVSIADKQVYSAFDSIGQVNAFLSMILNDVENALTVKMDAAIMRLLNAMIGETLYDAYKTGSGANETLGAMTGAGNTRAINMLSLYNTRFSANLTATNCLTHKEFIRYCAYIMNLTRGRMRAISRLFNVGGKARFTSGDRLHAVFLEEFYSGASVYLQSDVFHNEMTRLPNAETVPFWQGSGAGFDFTDTSKIQIKTPSGKNVTASGILGILFDREALVMGNMKRWTTTHYNANGDFINNWFKWDISPYMDLNENAVVFFVA
ncbi:MAG: hypothetical protein IJQ81_15330 [Oscillibacter sp.]|nr:hypothetical protein [Oscillibacter sp.]